jgi:hypothetical protein
MPATIIRDPMQASRLRYLAVPWMMRRAASVTVGKVPTGIQSLSRGVFIASSRMVNVCHWPRALSKWPELTFWKNLGAEPAFWKI